METMQLFEADHSSGKTPGGFGWHVGHSQFSPDEWNDKIIEAERLIEGRNLSRHEREYRIREAWTIDYMPQLFGDAIERRLQERLRGLPPRLDHIFYSRKVNHVGTDYPIRTKQAEGVLKRFQQIERLGEYPVVDWQSRQKTYYCTKWGARFDLALEDVINDDLGLFDRVATDLAESVGHTKAYLQITQFVDADGPLDTVFNASGDAVGQLGVSSNAFSIANLKAAIAEMTGTGSGYRTINGEPFLVVPRHIVTGGTLKIDVEEILASLNMAWGGHTTTVPRPTINMLNRMGLTHTHEPWIDVVVTTGTINETMWMLFTDNLPAGEFASLAGYEAPELFMQSSDAVRLGGGAAGPRAGRFADDSMAYKARMFAGASVLEERACWASDGQ